MHAMFVKADMHLTITNKAGPPSPIEQVAMVTYSSSVSGGDGSIHTPQLHQGQSAWIALGWPDKCVWS